MESILKALAVTMAAAMMAAGCASSNDRADGPAVTIEVHNNFAGAGAQEISIAGEAASPVPLGAVAAGETRRFTATGLDLADPHRLIATAAGGGLIRSAPVALHAGGHVVWDLSTNRVHVQE